MGKPPLAGDDGKAARRKAHGFANAHESVNRAHFRQHMGRVGSLALAVASANPAL